MCMMFQDFGQTEKKLLLLFLSCLLCWWLLAASATCSASGTPEPVYQITETELVQLENKLAKLSAINTSLQTELRLRNQELHVLREESGKLVQELNALKQGSQKQESSLANANKLLAEYATEAKKTRLRIKAQRNFWECVAACLVIGLAVK